MKWQGWAAVICFAVAIIVVAVQAGIWTSKEGNNVKGLWNRLRAWWTKPEPEWRCPRCEVDTHDRHVVFGIRKKPESWSYGPCEVLGCGCSWRHMEAAVIEDRGAV